jgi:antitoxin Phd
LAVEEGYVKDLWPLQEAQDRLEDVVEQAAVSGPQTITVREEPKAVVVSTEEYKRLTKPTTSLSVALIRDVTSSYDGQR